MIKKITRLTPKQIAKFPQYAEEWTKIGLCTDPADRPRAEAGIRTAYEIAGLKTPEHIVWCASPLSMAITRAIVTGFLKKNTGKRVRDSVWASVRDSVRDSVRASVRDSVGDSVWDSVRDSVGASVGESAYGQHDASWLAFYKFFREECGLAAETDGLAGLWEVAQSANWFAPHANICWVSERHCIVMQDDQKRIHCENGPAIGYPDGWSIYAWHGTRVPEKWITAPTTLTPQDALTWENIEQRRAACEILGWNVILAQLNAKTIDKHDNPQIGELLRVRLPDIGEEQFLRVRCGTGREFAIPVPPDMRTAAQANAWTYGFDNPEDYQIEVRT